MKRRILFVDDEPSVLQSLERTLHDHTDAWDMTFANSAQEALDALAGQPHDVAVLDIKMPGTSGLELLRRLKAGAQTRDIEVVMLTGLTERELKRQALDLGAADLLNKPVPKEDLVARLNSVLRMKAYREELKARNALLEEQLIQSQRMEVVGALAAGIAHDLKNMLTAILGYSELTERILPDETSAHKNVQQIRAAGKRARKLVQQILRFTTGAEAVRQRCHLAGIIDECLTLLRPSIPDTVDIAWDGAETDRLVFADAAQMYQIVMNLCLNAGQAMKHGGVLTVSLTESCVDQNALPPEADGPPGWYVRLEVADTGIGMDEATKHRIFEPLFTTNRAHGGSGLGLSVVQRIVKQHGGWIAVHSDLGEGTRFSVRLPCIEDQPATEATAMETADAER
jgi:signal transduction histidine kinase